MESKRSVRASKIFVSVEGRVRRRSSVLEGERRKKRVT